MPPEQKIEGHLQIASVHKTRLRASFWCSAKAIQGSSVHQVCHSNWKLNILNTLFWKNPRTLASFSIRAVHPSVLRILYCSICMKLCRHKQSTRSSELSLHAFIGVFLKVTSFNWLEFESWSNARVQIMQHNKFRGVPLIEWYVRSFVGCRLCWIHLRCRLGNLAVELEVV